jgi:mono/diheme cytochrome c family protein
MSDEPKNISQTPPSKFSGESSTVPTWIFGLMLLLLFVAGVYFDRHSGWFDAHVYSPYANADELESYQPKSGAEALRLQGKMVYEKNCGICHGTDGLGKPGQFPPLAGSEWVNAKSFKRVEMIPLEGINGMVHVKGQEWNASMAAMGAQLSDSDLAGVLTYIRSSWGNNAEPVTADDIKAAKSAVAGHSAINGEAQLKTMPE